MGRHPKDEEKGGDGGGGDEEEEDSPTTSKKAWRRFPLTRWEVSAAVGVAFVFASGAWCIYFFLPYSSPALKLPRSVSDLRFLKDHLAVYAKDHQAKFIISYCSIYIFMQTFMIPGTIFMSLLAGAIFGAIKGLFLVLFSATARGILLLFHFKISWEAFTFVAVA
ncbi:putative membrane protein [Acorus calamus]|uniref:Membrane protein n=1 Tax=Acorus calamus TaxID=4465 RepID=A0AAV9CIS8_ACOCL|nr:putative membrane protein [Acorus calamus]